MLRWTSRWLSHVLNPAPRHVRALGYVREMRALRARGARCKADWQPHLTRTREVVLEAAALCARRRTALVVGSGLLHDVPLLELSRQFEEVVLVDIVHPWLVHRQAERLANVRLIARDITGVVERCHALARSPGGPLPRRAVERLDGEPFDLVASVNILSQLPVLPNGYLAHHCRASDDELTSFSRALVEHHLDWLHAAARVPCLVADLERLHCDGDRIVAREASLWGVQLPAGGREWLWDLAPRPEIDLRYDVRHRVIGYPAFPGLRPA